jgi:predicted DNA-binding transcriptional regulator YafY
LYEHPGFLFNLEDMNRIDRVSAILIQLQSRRVVKASDIAERFNISLRTVYRDVKTLEEAGIPLIGEAGVGYSIVDGYRLPPVMFTKEEATAFLTAEKFVEKLTDASTTEHHKSAMFKIRAILKTAEKNLLEDIDGKIEVLRNHTQLHVDNKDHIQTLLNSIAKKNVLRMDYFANHSQQHTNRDVEPIGIFYKDSYWHLIAYCLLRKAYRDFRLDRINHVEVTGRTFTSKHPTLKAYIAQTAKEQELDMVIIRVDKSVSGHLEYQKYYSGFVSEKAIGSQKEMTFLTTSLEGFARWFMMFGDHAEIISPDSLKERVGNIASAIVKKNLQLSDSY